MLHRRRHGRRRGLAPIEDAGRREDREEDREEGERDDRDLRHRQRPAGDDELPLAGGARALVLRQDPHFLGLLVDAAVDTTLRLGRRLGLVEPIVVARVVVLLSLHGRDRTVFAGLPTSYIPSGGP